MSRQIIPSPPFRSSAAYSMTTCFVSPQHLPNFSGWALGSGKPIRNRRGSIARPRRRIRMGASAPPVPSVERLSNMTKFVADEILFFDRTNVEASFDPLEVIYAYPNEYSVGICSLGYQIVWATLSNLPDLNVTRLFTDAMEPLPYRAHLIGFSLSWELDYVGLFDQLRFAGVPRRAADRAESDPIVFGGGPVLTANPEPFADFFDVVLLGDGEDSLPAFIACIQQNRGLSRDGKLREIAALPGAYVPSLYNVEYESSTGPVRAVHAEAGVPPTVQKSTYRGRQLATSTVVTARSAWESIFMVEAVRSCPERCAFCLASYVTLPFRVSPVHEMLLPTIDAALEKTNRIGILGASVTQHPQFDLLLSELRRDKYDGMRMSIASVRTNTVTENLASTLVKRGTKSITIAIESGSERLRKIINKKLHNDDIITAAQRAKAGGLSNLKLYGMAGVPGEISEDHDETIAMFKAIRKDAPGMRLTFGCSTFVPKAHTPFQYFGVRQDAEKEMKRLNKAMGKMGVAFRPESYKWSVIQGLISRGDRRVSHILEKVSEYGDSLGCFRRAFKDLKGQIPPLEYYVFEDWPIDAVLPWGHIRTAISPEKILEGRKNAEAHFRPNSPEYSRVRLL